MKLLLTSNGISNQSIAKALGNLLDKPFGQSNLVFVPTAANVEVGDKGWLIDDLVNLKNLGFREIDIVDISALTKEQWQPRIEQADMITFGGGCTPHLLDWLTESGLAENRSLWETRVYMGISAGSIVAGREAIRELSNDLYAEDTSGCLGLADLVFLPHLNSESFPKAREDNIRAKASGVSNVYAIDDHSALSIIDGNVEVISEGDYLVL
jgi:dipeptidase E